MKKTGVWLLIAGLLIALGGLCFVMVACFANWNFKVLLGGKLVTETCEVAEKFSGVVLNTDTADITFALSDDGGCKVISCDHPQIKTSASVENGTLKIHTVDERKWYQRVTGLGKSTLTVYLPQGDYAALAISESTGDITIPKDFSFGSVDISVSTGDVYFYASASQYAKIKADTGDIFVKDAAIAALDLTVTTGKVSVSGLACAGDLSVKVSTGDTVLTDVACQNLMTKGSTGDLTMKNVIASAQFSIERSTGDVKMERCDAAEVFVTTDTGDVKATMLTDKIVWAKTDTGKVDVPRSTQGGKCEITTDTGNINISIVSD